MLALQMAVFVLVPSKWPSFFQCPPNGRHCQCPPNGRLCALHCPLNGRLCSSALSLPYLADLVSLPLIDRVNSEEEDWKITEKNAKLKNSIGCCFIL